MHQVPGFTGEQRHRFFNEHMHAGFHGCFRLFVVITVRGGDHHGVQVLLEQLLVIWCGEGHAKARLDAVAGGLRRRGDAYQLDIRACLQQRHMVVLRPVPCTDKAEADFSLISGGRRHHGSRFLMRMWSNNTLVLYPSQFTIGEFYITDYIVNNIFIAVQLFCREKLFVNNKLVLSRCIALFIPCIVDKIS